MRFLWVVAILSLAASSINADEVDLVTVWMDDGRVVTAEVDPRSDQERLWLTYSEPLITLSSSTAWQNVVQASYNDKVYSTDEFRILVLRIKGKTPASSIVEEIPAPRGETNKSQLVRRRPLDAEPVARPVNPPFVRSLMIDAELANWDSDVEVDGFLLYVYPLTHDWVSVPVNGTLQIEVIGQQLTRHRQPTRFFELARTSHRVRKQDFGPSHVAIYRIPFRTIHPEFKLDVGSHGLVHARLGVPGQGSFEASVHARLRTFDPVRDQLQLERGTRFFSSERTRGASP